MDITSTVTLNSGREMPILGLGTWQLTHDTAGTVEEAIRLDYPMIDTATDYGTHPGIGRAIRNSGIGQGEVYLVTKAEEDEDAYDATVRDLDELELDYADLMLIHRPPNDDDTSRELWEGLLLAKEDGLTRDVGVSNYTVEQIDDLIDGTGETPVVNQIEWTPFGWSPEMLDYCRDKGIIVQAYSPLTRAERLNDGRLNEIATAYDKTPAQILIRWDLQQGVVPLPKASSRNHLVENLDVFDFEISDDHMAELNHLNEHWSSLS